MSKLKSIIKALKYAPKRTAAVFLLLAVVLVPAAIMAWGPSRPTFTMENPASYITFNSITNNPSEGDERNFVRAKDNNNTSIGGFADIVPIQDNGTYLVRMYVHNNAAANLNLVAKNVMATTGLQSGYSTKVCLTGYINSSNANPTQIYDDVCFTNPKDFKVNYVGGSARYYTNANPSGFTIGNELFSTGAKLGYTSLNGDIPGCLQYSGILTFQVKAHLKEDETPKTPSYDVIKTVDKTSAKPGDTIKYTLTAKNTGNVDLTNVKINDTLPAYYSSASESITAPSSFSGSIINGGSVTIAKLPVGSEATITISYKIKDETAFECGKNTRIRNVVTSSTDQKNGEDRTDNNEANTDVTYDCPPEKKPSYDLAKTVDKPTAKPGDTLVYTLKFTNTGQVDLTNVIIKDQLPSGVDWTNVDINVNNGSGITDKEKLFESGVKIAIVKVGGTVTIKVTVKVKDDAVEAKECGENKATLVNRAESKTDQKPDQADNKDEDNPNNNSAQTVIVVNKECTYKYDLEKTVDKKTAKPGETVTYTLTFKNTGDQALSNVVVKDVLPGGVTYVAGSTTVDGKKADDGVTSDKGLNIGTVAAGKTVVIKFQAKMPVIDKLICGENKLVNKASAVTKEKQTEDRTDNNEATTTVDKECKPPKERCEIPGKGHLDKDDPACKPDEKPKCDIDGKEHLDKDDPACKPDEKKCEIPGKEHLNRNDPNCVVVIPTDGGSTSTGGGSTSSTSYYTPSQIVATGPAEAVAGIIAAGALTFGGAAYIRSRRAVRNQMKR